MRKTRAALVISTLCAALTSCLPGPEPAVPPPPKITADELFGEMDAYARRLESASGVVTISARTPEGVLPTTEHDLAFARPDSVYVESLGPMGEIAVVTRVSGGRMAVHYVADGVWAEGAATPGNVEKLVGVPLDVGSLIRALLAEPLVQGEGFEGTVSYIRPEAESDPTRLALRREDGTRALLITVDDSAPVPLEQVLYDGADAPVLRVEYTEYAEVDGLSRPRRILLEDYAGSSVEISFSSQEVNPALPEGLFDLTPPDGVRVVELDRANAP
jgi:outer membrane lipoprotein-sorting protein